MYNNNNNNNNNNRPRTTNPICGSGITKSTENEQVRLIRILKLLFIIILYDQLHDPEDILCILFSCNEYIFRIFIVLFHMYARQKTVVGNFPHDTTGPQDRQATECHIHMQPRACHETSTTVAISISKMCIYSSFKSTLELTFYVLLN